MSLFSDLLTLTFNFEVNNDIETYLSRIPSASIVNRIENLLSTVNIGRLGDKGNR